MNAILFTLMRDCLSRTEFCTNDSSTFCNCREERHRLHTLLGHTGPWHKSLKKSVVCFYYQTPKALRCTACQKPQRTSDRAAGVQKGLLKKHFQHAKAKLGHLERFFQMPLAVGSTKNEQNSYGKTNHEACQENV